MSSQNLPKLIAAGAVAAFLALGAWTLGHAGSSDNSASAAAQGPPGATTGTGQSPNGTTQFRGGPPGMGTQVTGATATKVAKAATAKYPGHIEQVMKLADGSYVAHVITSNGEVHVHVSRDFKVTGVMQGPPQGFGGSGGAQGAPPSGQAPDGSGQAPGGSGQAPDGSDGSGQSSTATESKS